MGAINPNSSMAQQYKPVVKPGIEEGFIYNQAKKLLKDATPVGPLQWGPDAYNNGALVQEYSNGAHLCVYPATADKPYRVSIDSPSGKMDKKGNLVPAKSGKNSYITLSTGSDRQDGTITIKKQTERGYQGRTCVQRLNLKTMELTTVAKTQYSLDSSTKTVFEP